MWGIPVAFLVGYAFARWFGDAIKSIAQNIFHEVGKAVDEWL